MYYVYVLYSEKDKRLYTGFTKDLRNRFADHGRGHIAATNYRLPLKLLYYEAYVSQTDAKGREYRLKASQGARTALRRRLAASLQGHLV